MFFPSPRRHHSTVSLRFAIVIHGLQLVPGFIRPPHLTLHRRLGSDSTEWQQFSPAVQSGQSTLR